MLAKTTILLAAAALFGLASTSMAASRQHDQSSAARSAQTGGSHEITGYAGYPDTNCTSCNLGSY